MSSKIGHLFKMIHSPIYEKDLIPIVDEDIIKAITDYGLDSKYFYKIENRMYQYCYVKDTVYIELMGCNKELFDFMELKRKIKVLHNMHNQCIKNNEYVDLFCYIDKPLRFEMYSKLFNQIPNKDKYKIFKQVYTSNEYGFSNLSEDFILEVYKHKKDTVTFKKEEIEIFRGEGSMSTPYTKSYSWTKEQGIAKGFAYRYDGGGKIYKGKVKSCNVLDYITIRGEHEIIVLPKDVYDVEEIACID